MTRQYTEVLQVRLSVQERAILGRIAAETVGGASALVRQGLRLLPQWPEEPAEMNVQVSDVAAPPIVAAEPPAGPSPAQRMALDDLAAKTAAIKARSRGKAASPAAPHADRMAAARAAMADAESATAHLGLAPALRSPARSAQRGHGRREPVPRDARCTGCHELFSECVGFDDCKGRWEVPLPQAEDDFPTSEPEEIDPW